MFQRFAQSLSKNIVNTPICSTSAVVRSFSAGQSGPRVFTAFKVYKPATALNVTPIGPRLLPKKNSLVLSRSGYVSLDIAPMQNKGYDWRNKSTFWLNLADIGNILESDGNVKFVREAVAQPGVENAVTAKRRVFSIEADKERLSYTISLQVQADQAQTQSIQLTKGEFRVLRELLSAAVPKLLMWEHGFEPVIDTGADGADVPASGDSEQPMAFGWQGSKQ